MRLGRSDAVLGIGPMAFVVRAYLAQQLACGADELVRTTGPTHRQDLSQSATYARRSDRSEVGQVTIGAPRRNLSGLERRLVIVNWDNGGRAQTDIGPDETVSW